MVCYSSPYVCSPGLLTHLRASFNGMCHDYYSINNVVTGDKIDLSTSLKFSMLIPLSQTEVNLSATQMGLAMTNNKPVRSTLSNKSGLAGNLHSILNREVNYDAFQPILSG